MIFISYYALFLFPSRPCAPKRANYGRKTKFPLRFYENSLDLTKYFCYNDYMIKYMQFSAKKLAILSVLTALGLVAFLLENLLPPLFVPGAKAGLSNVFPLLALVWFSPAEAFIVLILRTLLGSIFGGNVSALLYSLTAGVLSLTVSALLFKLFFRQLTVVAVSAFSACVHNTVQLLVYALLTSNAGVFDYLPFLLLAGIASGLIVGACAATAVRLIPLHAVYPAALLQKEYERENRADQTTNERIPRAEERAFDAPDSSENHSN